MRRTLTLSVIVMMASVAEAAAVCQQTDLAGRWAYFEFFNQVDPAQAVVTDALVGDCRFTIDADGVITTVTCVGSDDPVVLQDEFQGVEIQVSSTCRFFITGVTQGCNYTGFLSTDKITAAGVGRCGDDRLSFDLVNR